MNAPDPKCLVTLAVVAGVLLAAPFARAAEAQDRPAPAAELAVGALFFPDDGVVAERFVGGAVRFYALRRVSVGPEIAFIGGTNHSHLMLTGNLTFDLVGPKNGQPRLLTPFVVAGGGLFQTRSSFRSGDFTSSEGAFTAGGGIRALIGRHAFFGAEGRIGWEAHVRVNAIIGVRLGD